MVQRTLSKRIYGIIRLMDAFILFVMPPLLGYGIYLLMKNDGKFDDFIQSMIGYMKRIGKKKDE